MTDRRDEKQTIWAKARIAKHTVGRMMRLLQCVLLVAVSAVPLAGDDAPKAGYIDCSLRDKHSLTQVFSHPCNPGPAGSLSCGEKVEVLGREGPWLRIASLNGGELYIDATTVSQKKKQFVPIDLPLPSGPYRRCIELSEFRPKPGVVPAHPTYSPEPEYTEQARNAAIQGYVTLAVTIGTDGRAHDVKLLNALGYGLDEKAVETVKSWRFAPALQNGTPIESKLAVEVVFRTWKTPR